MKNKYVIIGGIAAAFLLVMFFLQEEKTNTTVDDSGSEISESVVRDNVQLNTSPDRSDETLKPQVKSQPKDNKADLAEGIDSSNETLASNENSDIDDYDTSNATTKTPIVLSEEEQLRVELTNEERSLSKRDRVDYRHESVFEREKDPEWSELTEETIRAGLINMPQEFNFYSQVTSVDCSDVICLISIDPFDFAQFRKSQMSFIDNVMAPSGLARFKAHRNVGEKSGIYAYRYFEILLPN